MSLQFSNPTLESGIIELIDTECKSNSTSYPTINKVADINLAWDELIAILSENCGVGQWDDNNHEKNPIIRMDLTQGQRNYNFTVDGQSNLILDVYKLLVADQNGIYHEIPQVDLQSVGKGQSILDGQEQTGQPTSYDRTGNGIFFNLVPSYSYTLGIKMVINREASYFTASDTTKKPGVDGRVHEWFVLVPAYKHACRESLDVKNDLEKRVAEMKARIIQIFGERNRDVRKGFKQGRRVRSR